MPRFRVLWKHFDSIVENADGEADACVRFRRSFGLSAERCPDGEVSVQSMGPKLSGEETPVEEELESGGTEEEEQEATEETEEKHDPTLAQLGIRGYEAKLLRDNGLTTRSQLLAYIARHGSLLPIDQIGPDRDAEIRALLDSFSS